MLTEQKRIWGLCQTEGVTVSCVIVKTYSYNPCHLEKVRLECRSGGVWINVYQQWRCRFKGSKQQCNTVRQNACQIFLLRMDTYVALWLQGHGVRQELWNKAAFSRSLFHSMPTNCQWTVVTNDVFLSECFLMRHLLWWKRSWNYHESLKFVTKFSI